MPLGLQLGRTMKHLRRYRHIVGVLFKYGFTEIAEGLNHRLMLNLGPRRRRELPVEDHRPEHLRMALEELGPTFVKLGQLLSTRPDLLPSAYIDELERLQDNVAPAPFDKVRVEIESQLHGRLEDLFERFEPDPIASASIAQVYRAYTREGKKAAIKVRRPGIVQTLRTECEILEGLAGLVKSTLPEGETIDPVRMMREFTSAVTREVDFTNELRNLQRFRANFAGDPNVHIAEPYEPYCAVGVLTMEFIDGVKPTDPVALAAVGLDGRLIAQRGSEFVLRQVFDFGLFHTDPHPGNFLVLPGNVLAPLDFGQVARLTSSDRYLVGELVLAIVDQDASRMVRAFRRSDMLSYSTDVRALTGDIEEMLDTYSSLPLEQVRLGRLMVQTFEVIRRYKVHPPPEFTMMLKSIMTVESLGMKLDKGFRIIDHLRPYAQRLSLEQVSPRRLLRVARRTVRDSLELLAKLPDDAANIINKFTAGQFQMHVHHEHLESLINTLNRSSNRVSFALIIAGIVIGSSILVTQENGTVLGLMKLQTLGTLGYITAAVLGLWLLASIIRGRHL